MLETLKQSIMINFSISLNAMIYFIKRMPIINILFKNVGYEHADVTKVLCILGIIYSMCKQLLKSILLLAIGIGLPFLFLSDNAAAINKNDVYWQLFIIFYLLLPLSSSKILEPHRRKFISVKLMRMNAKQFVIADYFPQLIWREIIELILFSFVAHWLSVNIILALFMVTAKNLLAISTEVMHIQYYNKTGQFLHSKYAAQLSYAAIILFAGYFFTLKHMILAIPEPAILILGILIWITGMFSVRFLIQYQNYLLILSDANKLDKLSVDTQSIKKNAEFSRVKLKSKEFSKEELQYDKTNKKEGFRYINHIFFKRHQRILNGPVKIQSIAIAALFVGGIILSFTVPDFNGKYVAFVKKSFPVFIYALYIMSTGQKATKAMFYNCDISLLHYGFYKKKEAVLATFTIRAIHLVLSNLIPAGLLAAALIVLDVFSGGNVLTLVPFGIMIIVLSVFFVIHNLFLYYIFQPYTTDLATKNPFYKFFNFVTYILCYISLQLRNVSITFLIIIVALTAVYSVAALIIVYRVAPKTFVVK